ncbi:MAG: hypothetical protein PHQ23_08410 [Candidatus Wallbacteria bacterium]|nr:hypothetical protein [Candidatus Wallbacteria bacterium]
MVAIVRDAVIRFRAQEGRDLDSLNELVPKYLPELRKDHWGHDLILDTAERVIISCGSDGKYSPDPEHKFNRDNIVLPFSIPLCISDARFTEAPNGVLINGSVITIYFSGPPLLKQTDLQGQDFVFCRSFIDLADTVAHGNADAGDESNLGLLTALPPEDGAAPGELGGKFDFVKFKVTRRDGCPFAASLFVRFNDSACDKYRTRYRKCENSSYNVKVKRPGEY